MTWLTTARAGTPDDLVSSPWCACASNDGSPNHFDCLAVVGRMLLERLSRSLVTPYAPVTPIVSAESAPPRLKSIVNMTE